MGIEFKLPNLGEGVSSADVAEILVKEGDTVSAGQIVMELETDKAVVELPCPHAGVVGRILVAEGATISVGQPVLIIEGAGAAAPTPAPKAAAPEAKPAPAAPASAVSAPVAATSAPALTPTIVAAPTLNPPPSTHNAASAVPIPAAPATRRLARELGVDISLVNGSGPGGRITQENVQAYVRGKLQQIGRAHV